MLSTIRTLSGLQLTALQVFKSSAHFTIQETFVKMLSNLCKGTDTISYLVGREKRESFPKQVLQMGFKGLVLEYSGLTQNTPCFTATAYNNLVTQLRTL